jgi:hypothetical protein
MKLFTVEFRICDEWLNWANGRALPLREALAFIKAQVAAAGGDECADACIAADAKRYRVAPCCDECRAPLTDDERIADSGLCWKCWDARVERCNQFVRECKGGK